jgi:hypothetical protein
VRLPLLRWRTAQQYSQGVWDASPIKTSCGVPIMLIALYIDEPALAL